MARNRKFLFGLGIGIVCGALLLQLMLVGQQAAEPAASGAAGEKTYTQAEVDAMLAADRDSAELNEQNGNPSPEPDAAAEPSPSASPSETPSEPDTASDSIDWRIIRIQGGNGLQAAGDQLKEEGIIADSAAFVKEMKSGGKLVRAGYFLFAGTPSLAEVTDIVSSTPLSAAQMELIQSRLDEAGEQAEK